MIAIGIQNPGDGRRVTTDEKFYTAFSSTMSIVFSYGSSLCVTSGNTSRVTLSSFPCVFIHHNTRLKLCRCSLLRLKFSS